MDSIAHSISPHEERNVDGTIDGLVVVSGRSHWVRLYSELLVLDGVGWFESLRQNHIAMATDAEGDGDLEFAEEMNEVARDIGELLAKRTPLKQPGMWPQVVNRSKFPLWELDVTDAEDCQRYANYLVEYAESIERPSEVGFIVESNGSGLILTLASQQVAALRHSYGVASCQSVMDMTLLANTLAS